MQQAEGVEYRAKGLEGRVFHSGFQVQKQPEVLVEGSSSWREGGNV